MAIRSATSLPAEILGLRDRGLLKEGMIADITVFDPKNFRDHATSRILTYNDRFKTRPDCR